MSQDGAILRDELHIIRQYTQYRDTCMMKKRIYMSVVALLLTLCGWAQGYRLLLNKETGIYDKGERIVVRLQGQANGGDTLSMQVVVNNRPVSEKALLFQGGEMVVYDEAVDSTCAVMLEIGRRRQTATSIGFVVAPQGFRAGYSEPADLMDYWMDQKKQLKALPVQVKSTALAVPAQYEGKYVCNDVEINCLGPAPVRAYVAKPVGARKKSLPIVVLCRAAGVSGNWCRCQVGECVGNASLGNGALSLDINAHGMLNGQSDAFYKMLEDGMLKNYYEHNVLDRETYYFRGMYLRLLRAIEYMTQMPEWDGKRILVMGESQGGGQAVAVAGLDSRVSCVVLNVPALQDLGGSKAGRRGGWPQPLDYHANYGEERLDAVLPYFDGALLLRHSRAEIYCEMGLIDTTCPPSSVWASLNGAPGRKTVNCVPFRTHAWPEGEWRPYWEEKYLRPRQEFTNNYLK